MRGTDDELRLRSMSDLLPQLYALRGQLIGDAASQQHARALADAIAQYPERVPALDLS